MANIEQLSGSTAPRSFGHDISIPIASRSLKRAFVAGMGATLLVWIVAMTSGCSTTTSGDASGTGGKSGADDAGAGDGPILTACPAVQPAAGTACAGSLSCTYGQVPCCGHFEPDSVAYCQSGRISTAAWESACILGSYVCPADGGVSDATDGVAPDGGLGADAQADGASSSGG